MTETVIAYLTLCANMLVIAVIYVLGKLSGMRFTRFYLIVPLTLCIVHTYGEFTQLYNVGPGWLQDHLHNVGLGAFSVLFVGLVVFVVDHERKVRFIVMGVPVAMAIMTSGLVVIEILDTTLWRAENMADGYSGEFDWGDVAAYGIGLGLVVLNYYVLRAKCYSYIQN